MASSRNKKLASCGLCCTRIENFSVKKGTTVILDNVNMHIHCGELTAVIGPNGGGKSTLLRSILGEVKHTGTLSFLNSKNEKSARPRFGYVPQNLSFDRFAPVSVLDLFGSLNSRRPVWLGVSQKIRKLAQESLAITGAEHLINKRLGDLSGGELQRVLLALALVPLPDLLLLDEPVSGIDQAGLELFYKIVSNLREKYDLSIILVSHDLELVSRYADRVILLDKKIIASGRAAEVFERPEVEKIFGHVKAVKPLYSINIVKPDDKV